MNNEVQAILDRTIDSGYCYAEFLEGATLGGFIDWLGLQPAKQTLNHNESWAECAVGLYIESVAKENGWNKGGELTNAEVRGRLISMSEFIWSNIVNSGIIALGMEGVSYNLEHNKRAEQRFPTMGSLYEALNDGVDHQNITRV